MPLILDGRKGHSFAILQVGPWELRFVQKKVEKATQGKEKGGAYIGGK